MLTARHDGLARASWRATLLYVPMSSSISGQVTNVSGTGFAGPKVIWKTRRAVLRQSRRWSTAWSPEQIVHRLRIDYPEDPTMRISPEAIYQSLWNWTSTKDG